MPGFHHYLSLFWSHIAIAVELLPALHVCFHCHFVNMRRNWTETTFRNDKRNFVSSFLPRIFCQSHMGLIYCGLKTPLMTFQNV